MTRPLFIYTALILSFVGLTIFIDPLFSIGIIIPVVILVVVEFAILSDKSDSKIFAFLYIRRLKRVKTEYGRFYVTITNGRNAILYQDKFFYLRNTDYTNYINLEQMKAWIKQYVDYTYRNVKAKSDLRNELMTWNGHIDKQSERAEKLNNVI